MPPDRVYCPEMDPWVPLQKGYKRSIVYGIITVMKDD
jgi:hypothetical protein